MNSVIYRNNEESEGDLPAASLNTQLQQVRKNLINKNKSLKKKFLKIFLAY
jgi:hypothetical protein